MTDFLQDCTDAARAMRGHTDPNDVMMAQANQIAMRHGVEYADAKGTIRWLYDGNDVGLRGRE